MVLLIAELLRLETIQVKCDSNKMQLVYYSQKAFRHLSEGREVINCRTPGELLDTSHPTGFGPVVRYC